MISGCEKAGIVPLNRDRVLEQLPESSQANCEDMSDVQLS